MRLGANARFSSVPDIAVNAPDIAVNASDIAVNAPDIAVNETRHGLAAGDAHVRNCLQRSELRKRQNGSKG